MTHQRTMTLALAIMLIPMGASIADEEGGQKTFTYRKTTQAELELMVDFPDEWNATDRRPAIVFFFGGGWTNGSVKQFESQASYLASRGMVAARADYRVKSRHGVTPKECVEDAQAAVRWLRSHSGELGIDPDRIVAAGGSAGGHLAASTCLSPIDGAESADASVSSKPNALVLFNPALKFVGVEKLMNRVDNDEDLAEKISPTLHMTEATPPALLFFGTADPLIVQGQEYVERAKQLGVRAEMYEAEGKPHGFFNRSPWLERTTYRVDEFLESLGYLEGKPTIEQQ